MQLTQLEIKGFKSFGDKITINFNEGVTAIAGPNGCGKSNVVDSIRWVLGEQSTRALRSEKMDNIIFNGTKTRKAANLAQVSLTFDNTKNLLPTDFSQVTITRRLYRSGESEYLLNDVQCRLKDITDLFLDTGIGANSYAIIELKMIDEIINNKEGSRRNLFEEASGISKYKLRKKQTFNKLKDTEADLERVEDLLFEIEKNLKSLENQARKTERYYRLRDQYKELSISLASFRIAGFSRSLAVIEDKEQIQRTERSGIAAQIDTLEASLQQAKLDSLTREKNLAAQQKASNEFTARIRAYESEKRIKNEQLKHQQDKEARLKDELERDGNQFKHVQYNIKRLNEEKLQEDDNLQALTLRVADLKETVDELRASQGEARGELNELNNITNRLQNQAYKAEKDIDILTIQQQALEQESHRNMEDASNKEAELSHFNVAVAELDSRAGTLKGEYDLAVEGEGKLQEQITGAEEKLKSITGQIAGESRKLDAKQNEFNLTKSLVDNLEGFPESIRFLKKNTNWAKTITLFSDVLFCKEDYRVAVENYLEPLMNHYVVNTYTEAIAAINLLGNAAKGRAQFFILNNYDAQKAPGLPAQKASPKPSPEGRALEFKVSPSGGDLEGSGSAVEADFLGKALTGASHIPALSVIDVDDRYRALCTHLLQHVYLVNDQSEQDINADQLPHGIVLIGKSGKFIKSRHTMAGGSVGLFEGKRIGRAKNLDNLLKEIKQVEGIIAGFKTRSEELQSKLVALKASTRADEIRQKQTALNQLNTELITVKTKQEQYQAFIENSLNRKQDIANKIISIQQEIQNLGPVLAELKTQRQIQADLMMDKQQAFNQLNEMVTVQSNTYNQENIRFHQQQNRVSGLVKDLEYRETQLEHLETRLRQNNAEMEKVKAAILENLQQTGDSDDSLLEMYGQKDSLEKGTQEAEQEYYAWRSKITESENEVSKLRQKKDQAEAIESDLKDERNNLKLELNALKERLSVEFNVDINDLLDIEINDTANEGDIRDKTEKMKRQLDDFGAINPMAVEAYNEMSERHTFIQAQKKDLAEAKASLLATIQEIDDTAKEKFMAAFMSVRENFIKVFRSLFNEQDSCDLILSDPERPLESDIDIIARPKGKRPLSINQLSGGEKTLTATAILFSLYLLKPAPFCIFDEVDAPLDDTNIDKFNNIIRKFSQESQFIIISHNKRTIACTDIVYGVTMVEQGISRVVPVDLREFAE